MTLKWFALLNNKQSQNKKEIISFATHALPSPHQTPAAPEPSDPQNNPFFASIRGSRREVANSGT
jgi:hypothetical protein